MDDRPEMEVPLELITSEQVAYWDSETGEF